MQVPKIGWAGELEEGDHCVTRRLFPSFSCAGAHTIINKEKDLNPILVKSTSLVHSIPETMQLNMARKKKSHNIAY